MSTAWLLLLLIVSSQSVDGQPTTDDKQERSCVVEKDVSGLKRYILIICYCYWTLIFMGEVWFLGLGG